MSLSCARDTKVKVERSSGSTLYGPYFHIYLDDAMITLEESVAAELAEKLREGVQRSAEAEIK